MPGWIGSGIFILRKHEKRCYSFSPDCSRISAGATECEAGNRRDSPEGHGGRARHGPGNCPRAQSPLPDPCRYGFRASLDTLDIFRKTQTVTNTVVQRVEVPGKPKRWGIGVSAGYALTPQGVKPYIGAGISYSFITF